MVNARFPQQSGHEVNPLATSLAAGIGPTIDLKTADELAAGRFNAIKRVGDWTWPTN